MENVGNNILEGLNPAQKEAVMCLTGPSLIVAGAGSGKTKVLTCKIANILSHGYKPYSVLALTLRPSCTARALPLAVTEPALNE